MRVGVLCEYSGVVRDAFIRRGHDAISCDILPTESPGPHIQGDCLAQDWGRFDILIAHPPCTYLSYAGTSSWHNPGRAELRAEAMRFFMACWNLPCDRMCIENPFGLPSQVFRQHDQIVNPFDFGEPIRKRTCLWLRGLPCLFSTDQPAFAMAQTGVAPPRAVSIDSTGKKRHHTDAIGGHKDRQKRRSRFFVGIADAMADQWGGIECPT